MKRVLLSALFLGCAGCATLSNGWHATSDHEADRLFHRDPRWLGADAAYSVPLDGDRVLWLFGDTFIGDGKSGRAEAAFIRNSIAIQTGRDVERADISFHWGGSADSPESFFPSTEGAWLWPLHGLYHDGTLTLFFMRIVQARGGLGFAHAGAAVLRADDVRGPPESWEFSTLTLPQRPQGLDLLFGVALFSEGEDVYGYCARESGDHATYLARWTQADFDLGRLSAAQWWDGGEWRYATQLANGPAVVFRPGATEFSVHKMADGRYVQVQSAGFPQSTIAVRVAPNPEGPWSRLHDVYRPKESRRRGTLVYAAKAHPELDHERLVVTYAANHFDARILLTDPSLYFPRFVLLSLPE